MSQNYFRNAIIRLGKTSTDYQPLLNLHSRATLLANGSMWLEAVSPQDEGHYMCRATNGIGSGLAKVIYVGVNGNVLHIT